MLETDRPLLDISFLELDFDTLLRASQFNPDTPIAVNLVNRAGDDLGEVEELVFDIDDGEALYGIAEVGGFLGVAEAPTVIAWSEMLYDDARESLVIDADEATLTNAPKLNLDDWGDQDGFYYTGG